MGLILKKSHLNEYAELIEEDYKAYADSKGKGKMVENDNLSDDDILCAVYNSSDEEMDDEFLEFNEKRDMENPDLFVSQAFTNIDVFRAALRTYSIRKGFELQFRKNDANRLIAICANVYGCRIYASFLSGSKVTFQIKSIKGIPHNFPLSYQNRNANARWLSKM